MDWINGQDRREEELLSSICNRNGLCKQIPAEKNISVVKYQNKKWELLPIEPLYELANPVHGTEQDLIDAGKKLVESGADVLVLDCLGFHQKHRDLLQKSLDVPVLLSNVLIARLASELLA